jgi:hypothetical protein
MYKQQYNNSFSSEEEYSSEDSFSEEDPPLNIMSNKSKLDLYNNEQYQGKSAEKKHLIFIDTGDRYFNSEYNRFNFKCKLSTSGNSWSKYPIYENTKEIPQNNSQNKLGIPGSPNMNGFIYNNNKYDPYNASKQEGGVIAYNNIYTSNENILSIQNNIKNINCIKVKSVFIPKIFFHFNYNKNILLKTSEQEFMFLDIKELHDNYLTTSPYRNVFTILKKKENNSESGKYIEYVDISDNQAFYKGIYPSINTLTFDITFPNKINIDGKNIINSVEDYLEIEMIMPIDYLQNNGKNNHLYILLNKSYHNGYFKEGANILLKNINNFGNLKVTYPLDSNYNPRIIFEDYYVKKIIRNYLDKGYIHQATGEINESLPFIFLNDSKIFLSEKDNLYQKISNIKVCQLSSTYFPQVDKKFFYNIFFYSNHDSIVNLEKWIMENNNIESENKTLIQILDIFLEKKYLTNTINIPVLEFDFSQITKKIFGFSLTQNILKNNLSNIFINNNNINNEIIYKNVNNIILENRYTLDYYPTYVAFFSNIEGHSKVMEMILKFRRTAYSSFKQIPFSDSGYFQIKDDSFLLPENIFSYKQKYITFYYKVRGSSECPVDNKGNLYIKNNNDPYDLYGCPSNEEQIYDTLYIFRNKEDTNRPYLRNGLLSFFNSENYHFKLNGEEILYTKTKGYSIHNTKQENIRIFNLKEININFRNNIIPDKEGNSFIKEPVIVDDDKQIWPPIPKEVDIFPKMYSENLYICEKTANNIFISENLNNQVGISTFSNIREDYFMLSGPRIVQEWCIGNDNSTSAVNNNLKKVDSNVNLHFISLKVFDIKYKLDLTVDLIEGEKWSLLVTAYIIDKYNINLNNLFEKDLQTIEQYSLLIYTDVDDIKYFYNIFIKTDVFKKINIQQPKNEIIKLMVVYFRNYLNYNLNNFLFRKKITELVNNFSIHKIYKWLNKNPQGSILLVNTKRGQSLEEIYSLSSYKINYDYFDNKIWITGSDSYLLWKEYNNEKDLEMVFLKNLNLSFKTKEDKELYHQWTLKKENIFVATNINFNVFKLNDIIEIFTDNEKGTSLYDLMQKKNNLGILEKKEYDIEFYPNIKTEEKFSYSNMNTVSYNIKSQILIKGKSNSQQLGEIPDIFLPENIKNNYKPKNEAINIPKNFIPYLNEEDFQEMKRISVLNSKKDNNKNESNIIVIKDANSYSPGYNKTTNYLLKNNFVAGTIEKGKEILFPILVNLDLQTKLLLEIDSVEASTNTNENNN